MSEAPKVYITSILNDIRRKFDSPEFTGGAVTSVLGSADMDLREAKMKAAEAHLDITNVLGSVYIYPADNWDVRLEISEIAGKVKDRRKRSDAKKRSQKTLFIRGATVLGDVYIR
jgi:predicted membrane protein